MAEKKIKGTTYRVEPMLAMDAIRLQARLLGVIGGAVDRLPVMLVGAGKDKTEQEKADSNAAAVAAFTDIFVNGNPDQMANLVKDIAENAKVLAPSGAYDPVDVDFYGSDQLTELFEVVVFVLKETFGAFFSELLNNGKIKKVVEASKSGKPKE